MELVASSNSTFLRACVFLALCSLIPQVQAKWVHIGATEEAVYSVETGSIRIYENQIRRAWVRTQFFAAQNVIPSKSHSSYRSLDQFDCREERARSLQLEAFSGYDLEGEIIFTYNEPTKWVYASPGSIKAGIMKFVCSYQ